MSRRAFVVGLSLVGMTACGGGGIGEPRASTPSAISSSTPTPTAWSPLQERGASVAPGRTWHDAHDTTVGGVDAMRVRFYNYGASPHWSIELASKPPLVADLESGMIIAYGLVLDATGDGDADYLIGIDNNAPRAGGAFRVWVTDLATEETDEQIGPSYGYPIDFIHPDGQEPGDPPTMLFFFLPGAAPADLDPTTAHFYAWASVTRDGEVIAWDTAPDTGWMNGPWPPSEWDAVA